MDKFIISHPYYIAPVLSQQVTVPNTDLLHWIIEESHGAQEKFGAHGVAQFVAKRF